MIAKIIAVRSSRTEALARLRRAVQTTVVIEGGATNKSFILDLLAQPEVVAGGEDGWADTGWIDRVRAQGGSSPTGTPAWRSSPPPSTPTRTRNGRRSTTCWRPRAVAGPTPSTRWAGRSTSSCAGRRTR